MNPFVQIEAVDESLGVTARWSAAALEVNDTEEHQQYDYCDGYTNQPKK